MYVIVIPLIAFSVNLQNVGYSDVSIAFVLYRDTRTYLFVRLGLAGVYYRRHNYYCCIYDIYNYIWWFCLSLVNCSSVARNSFTKFYQPTIVGLYHQFGHIFFLYVMHQCLEVSIYQMRQDPLYQSLCFEKESGNIQLNSIFICFIDSWHTRDPVWSYRLPLTALFLFRINIVYVVLCKLIQLAYTETVLAYRTHPGQ